MANTATEIFQLLSSPISNTEIESIREYLYNPFRMPTAHNMDIKTFFRDYAQQLYAQGSPLRSKMIQALSRIIIVTEIGGFVDQAAVNSFYEIVHYHALGNYKDLIRDVTYSSYAMPQMLTYLGSRNEPEDSIFPDENYAREILQLFTLGLETLNKSGVVQLNPDGTPQVPYDPVRDVKELSPIFTGFYTSRNVEDKGDITLSGNSDFDFTNNAIINIDASKFNSIPDNQTDLAIWETGDQIFYYNPDDNGDSNNLISGLDRGGPYFMIKLSNTSFSIANSAEDSVNSIAINISSPSNARAITNNHIFAHGQLTETFYLDSNSYFIGTKFNENGDFFARLDSVIYPINFDSLYRPVSGPIGDPNIPDTNLPVTHHRYYNPLKYLQGRTGVGITFQNFQTTNEEPFFNPFDHFWGNTVILGTPLPSSPPSDLYSIIEVLNGGTFDPVNDPDDEVILKNFKGTDREIFSSIRNYINNLSTQQEKDDFTRTVCEWYYNMRQAGIAHIDSALDIIFENDNFAPFVCKQLIKCCTTSNPSEEYVGYVVRAFEIGEQLLPDGTTKVGTGEKGDLLATAAAIFLHKEAFGESGNVNISGRAKYAFEMEAQLCDFILGRNYGFNSYFPGPQNLDILSKRKGTPFNDPSVFGDADLLATLPGSELSLNGLLTPELSIYDESEQYNTYETFKQHVDSIIFEPRLYDANNSVSDDPLIRRLSSKNPGGPANNDLVYASLLYNDYRRLRVIGDVILGDGIVPVQQTLFNSFSNTDVNHFLTIVDTSPNLNSYYLTVKDAIEANTANIGEIDSNLTNISINFIDSKLLANRALPETRQALTNIIENYKQLWDVIDTSNNDADTVNRTTIDGINYREVFNIGTRIGGQNAINNIANTWPDWGDSMKNELILKATKLSILSVCTSPEYKFVGRIN